jgi:hypothetical protein
MEEGNKHSLMGIYHGDMYLRELPAFLPKLCAWVRIVTTGLPHGKLYIRVLQDDETLFNDEWESSDAKAGETFVTIGAIALSPLRVETETFLRVVVEVEGEELSGSILRIRQEQA